MEHIIQSLILRDQQKYFNKSGQGAALALKNFRVQALARKLAPTYIKVKILEGINKNAYRSRTPSTPGLAWLAWQWLNPRRSVDMVVHQKVNLEKLRSFGQWSVFSPGSFLEIASITEFACSV